MNLLKNNPDLNRILQNKPVVIFAFDYNACYLIRPMPRDKIDYNHCVYWYNGIPYIITQCDDRYIANAEIIMR
jgi:hypothetical protein